MIDISAILVKKLRERTGVGMMDCKKALIATSGNVENAIDWLRKNGISAISRTTRIATDGLVGVASTETRAIVVEVNAETDFVARNTLFQNFVRTIIDLSFQVSGDLERLKKIPYPGCDRTVEEEIMHLVTIIGENIKIRRTCCLSIQNGIIASYVHNQITPGLGKIAVLVSLEASTKRKDRLIDLGHQIAMHIAAAAPQFIDISSIQETALDRERSILLEQARILGKPAAITAKMIDGKLQKYYEETVLLEQIYVINGKSRVKDILKEVSQEIGSPIKIGDFVRFSLGESIACMDTSATKTATT